MPNHYDVLGVSPQASYDEVRHAYLERARAVHPDRVAEGPASESGVRGRSMQEVNEAWRVLRDPSSRAAYDRALAGGRRVPRMPPTQRPAPRPPRARRDEDEDLDTPYPQTPADPGDIGVSMARALPWVAVTVILVIIFVFTAFAGGSHDPSSGPHDLVGKCISSGRASVIVPVPCQGPNEGQVKLVVDRASLCPDASSSRSVPGDLWLCLEPFNPIPKASTATTTSAPSTPSASTAR